MTSFLRALLCVAGAWLVAQWLGGCEPLAPVSAAGAQPAGIAWFKGSMDEALAEAHRPLLGDDVARYVMYLRELPNTATPYHYMSHLSALAGKAGRNKEAVEWLAKASAAADGPATRARWASAYLRGLLRYTPDDTQTVRTVAAQVAAELAGNGDMHGRTRSTVTRTRKSLAEWGNEPGRRALARELNALLVGAT